MRDYAAIILKRWQWIVGLTSVAVVVAAIVSFLTTPTYEATAMLSVPQASPLISIAYASLVDSTEVESQVIDALKASLSPAEQLPGGLIDKVNISPSEDQSLIRIAVQSNTPKKAALLANTWANISLKQLKEGHQEAEDRQLQMAKQNLEAASQALIEFEEENGFGVFGFGTLGQKLENDLQALTMYEKDRNDTQTIIQQLRSLRGSIYQKGAIPAYWFNSLLTTVTGPLQTGSSTPGSITELTMDQQLRILDSKILMLEAKERETSAVIEQLSASILQRKKRWADKQLELDSLTRARDIIQSIYVALAEKEATEKLALQFAQEFAQVIHPAVEPRVPIRPNVVQNVLIAGTLGLLVGALGSFAVEYFKGWGRRELRETGEKGRR